MSQVYGPLNFPTHYAREIAIAVGIHPADEFECENMEEYERCQRRLGDFQMMSFHCEFEKCIMHYKFVIELDEKKLEALKVIYDMTCDWSDGYIMSELLKKLSDRSVTGRDVAEVARTIKEFQKKDDKEKSVLRRSLIIRERELTEEERKEFIHGPGDDDD